MADGDQWRILRFRDACLRTGGLSFYVGELFDALANDDLETAQRAAVAYVHAWLFDTRTQRDALAALRRKNAVPDQIRRMLE